MGTSNEEHFGFCCDASMDRFVASVRSKARKLERRRRREEAVRQLLSALCLALVGAGVAHWMGG